MMSNQKLQFDSVYVSRCRGTSPVLPSVSRFRSGYLPSGVNVNPVMVNQSDSDMDTFDSSEEDQHFGARYSLESSPQDDKIDGGISQHNKTVGGVGNCIERQGGRCGAVVDDESSPKVTSKASKRVTCAATILEPKIHLAPNSSSSNVQEYERQLEDFCNAPLMNKFYDDDIPTAPPLAAGTFTDSNQVSTSRVPDGTAVSSETSRSSTAEAEPPQVCKSTMAGSEEAEAPKLSFRNATADSVSSQRLPVRFPTYHASGLGSWYAVVSYDACVRLCLNAWAKGSMEAPYFLENECAILRDAFGLKHILLRPEEELMIKKSSDLVGEEIFVKAKTKKTIGKVKTQVRKVKMAVDPPAGCSCASLKSSPMVKLESIQLRLSNVKTSVSCERRARRSEHVTPIIPANGSLLHRTMAYAIVGTRRFLKEVPDIIKIGFNACSSSSSYELVPESYSCSLRLKSSAKEDAARMQPGSQETRIFFPDGLGDDLIIEVHDSKGNYCGHAVVQVADIAEESGEKLRQCFIYREPEHEQVGKLQLYVNYSTMDENKHKCGIVAETIAYDCVLEAAMKVQQFQQRNFLLQGSWKWLVTEFASYFGVSDAYTKLRYVLYVMDVATPTADCLDLVHDLLQPVTIKSKSTHSLSHQEARLLGEVSDEVEQMVTLVFENYKSLDESSPSGMLDEFGPATGEPAPALVPAFKLYELLHDILSPEVQSRLCRYFQNAIRKRCKRHLSETDEYVSGSNENLLSDPAAISMAYKKMKSLCSNMRNEILCDIEIQKQNLLPSFIDLPNLSSSIYSTELNTRLRAFLVSCPPAGPTLPVVELVVATADFQRDLSLWKISNIKGGVDAKELFHLYIAVWIQDKRLALLELCKVDRGKSSNLPAQHLTMSFINDVYSRLKEMLAEYEVIISRWPEYIFALEYAIADVEKAIMGRLEKEYAEVLVPLRVNKIPQKFGINCVQKFAKGNMHPYTVSVELGVVLNTMRRMLDVLRPQIEGKLKSWGSCIPGNGDMLPGERLSEIAVMIRSKFRAYVQAVIDRLVENASLYNGTKLKKIIQNTKGNVMNSDLRHRMQPLKELLTNTINQLQSVLETQVFITICRGFWDRMGQDMLKFLEGRKENESWYKASRIAVTVLDDMFVSQMQQLLGNALQEKHIEPPQSILEVRSMLCKDTANYKGSNYYY
ncbi:uncharacterized protein LOC127248464 isoform X2 [Andrographis paniculata]|uniref:uncharacterized protein LOC127248464 isoform X2 n=1 Tax=Andrographis paniculata TaxID=175694 RepID=UPI0021E7617E|nr:uncharacterized protein LOC127248464 isoform X2 [Andrographis paniculata]